MYLYEADFWCSSSKKHSLIIAPIYPNLDQSSGLLEAQEQGRNLYKDLKLFLKPFKSTWKLSWSWEKAITGQTWFHADSNPSTAHWYQIHMQRNFWKLFSLNRPWDSDLEVVSCVAGGIIWCLIKTGSVSALDTSSPSSLLPYFPNSHGSNLSWDFTLLDRVGEENNFTGKSPSSHWPDSKYWILSPSKTHQIFLLKQDHQRWRYITVNHLMGI